MRILIAEDDIFTRMELEMILAEAGHEVVGSVSGIDEALAVAGVSSLDAAVVDLGLSGNGRGVDLARTLRAQHGIRSLLISGRLDQASRDGALDVEPLGFVEKPFNKSLIVEALAAVNRS